MKKRIISAVCFCSLLTLFLIGCKTPPKDTPAVPEEQSTSVESGTAAGSDLKTANAELIRELNAARKKAVAAGADRYLRDELAVVDVAAGEAQAVYKDGGDPAEFNTKASDILYQYKALEQAALAAAARKK